MGEVVTIETIGHRGDGIVSSAGGLLYVPFALPGEEVEIEREEDRARIVAIRRQSPERSAPPCMHFGRCGGCALQMLPLDATRRLKRGFVAAALAQRGLDCDVAETIGVAPASRRRAVLTALRTGSRLVIGYRERLSHRIVDLASCPVLAPGLDACLPDIRALAERLVTGTKPARLTALLTNAGVDLDIAGIAAPTARGLAALAGEMARRRIARLSVAGEPVLTLAEPTLALAGIALTPPPGAFVQASADAEAAMTGLIAAHLRGARRIADLFAGVGTFALALARIAPVHAVESNGAALAALSHAAQHASGLKPIGTEVRDLFAHPLAPGELRFDAVIFDPPRAGAKAQAEMLAASKVSRVAAVSCNPATFARDARILIDGGFRLERVVPVDQFVYSADVEVVGLFSRPQR